MKKILCLCCLLVFCFSLPSISYAAQSQTTTLTTVVPAPESRKLEELINEENEKKRDKNSYTEASWEAYKSALEEAKEVLKHTSYDEGKCMRL